MHPIPSLAVNRRRATLLLIAMSVIWVILLIIMRLYHEQAPWIDILVTGAEAGMIGGLADWYAITVLFHDPFKYIWTPRFIRDHTQIIPRNKNRIADSMGRFVQENFLAPHIVRQNILDKDVVLVASLWLKQDKNAHALTRELKRLVPKMLRIFEKPDIEQFFSQNLVEWLKNTRINKPLSQILDAIFANQIHQSVIQVGLDVFYGWIQKNPEQTRYILQKVLDESSVLGFVSRGATMFGFDIKEQAITGVVKTVGELQKNPEHPIRRMISESMLHWMERLKDDESEESIQIETLKNDLLNNETVTRFVLLVTNNIRDNIIQDLESSDSSIAYSLERLAVQIARALSEDASTRSSINLEIANIAEFAAERYADAIIAYIRVQIQAWDTEFMIDKIESEVGGDLHMIRINGVVVGAMIGLILGSVQFAINLT